ncbi:MAG: tetratricopeptide repeat protein, partial [Acidobacteria bacterium]|nr:tetratricopeptide repeat protein [Acidobacteriota bacterium]
MRASRIACALAIAIAVAQGARAAGKGDAEYAAGEIAFRQGDNTAAEAHFRKAIEADPDNLRALVKLATVVSYSDRLAEAVDLYDRALKIDPGSADARSGLARTLSWKGDYDRAIEIYRGLLAESPDSRDASLGLARTLAWTGRTAESRDAYLGILAANPQDVEARNGLAASLSWAGHLDDALALYDETLTIAPDNKDALAGRARVLQWQGRPRPAARAAAAALRAHPDDREAQKVDASIRDGLATVVDGAVGFVHDTDRNEINTEHAGATLSPSPSLTVGGSLDRFGARGPGASSGLIDESLLSPRASLTYRFDGGLALSGAAGADRVDGAESTTHFAGSAGAAYRIDDHWSISGAASKGVFAATARSLLADVEIRSLSATAALTPIPSIGVRVTAESDTFTDENARRLLACYARWALPLRRPRVGVSWSVR